MPPKSSGVTETSSPPLMFSPSRASSLMPFVTTRPASLAAATTCPPGQTQNENTPRPDAVWAESLYEVGGSEGWPAYCLYCCASISLWRCSMRTPTAKGFGSIGMPASRSMAKVSRALWPTASTACSAGSVYVPSGDVTRSAASRPSLRSSPVT